MPDDVREVSEFWLAYTLVRLIVGTVHFQRMYIVTHLLGFMDELSVDHSAKLYHDFFVMEVAPHLGKRSEFNLVAGKHVAFHQMQSLFLAFGKTVLVVFFAPGQRFRV